MKKELENLLTMTKRMHDALCHAVPAEIDMAATDLIEAAKLVEAAYGQIGTERYGLRRHSIGPEDRPICREILVLSAENERLARERAESVTALLYDLRNHGK